MTNTHEQQPLLELPFDGPSLRVPILLLMAILSSGSVSAERGEGGREGGGEGGSTYKAVVVLCLQ